MNEYPAFPKMLAPALSGRIVHEMPHEPYYPAGAIRYFPWLQLPYFEVVGYFIVSNEYVTSLRKISDKNAIPWGNEYNIPKYERRNNFIFKNWFHARAWEARLQKLKIVDYYSNVGRVPARTIIHSEDWTGILLREKGGYNVQPVQKEP